MPKATLRPVGGDGTDPLVAHNPSEATASRVYVNELRIPVADVDVHIRNEGPLAITRYAEVEFPSPYNGQDYLDAFRGSRPSLQSDWDTLRIELRDTVTGEYHTEFHGLVTGVGSSASDNDRIYKARARGPGHFLDKQATNIKLDEFDLAYGLDRITDALDGVFPFPVVSALGEDAQAPQATDPEGQANVGGIGVPSQYVAEENPRIGSKKHFRANRHTLADVVDYVAEKTGADIWLQPVEDGAVLTTVSDVTHEYRAHYLDQQSSESVGGGSSRDISVTAGDSAEADTTPERVAQIIANDALSELRPVNSAVAKGQAEASYGADTDIGLSVTNQYAKVTARHETLYERAGRTELTPGPYVESDGQNAEEVANDAVSALKEALRGATGGDMTTRLVAPVLPFDTIRAKPTCRGQSLSDTDPLTYEVHRVHHHIPNSGIPTTTLNVGVAVRDEDIVTERSWESVGT
ncbi:MULTISPECIES: hypothetical protein [Salinibaculum]|uniref:hypothetical protein n=1 Tax=Salinibaculum TaxID=2732368 RepID=UPI0030CF18A7